MVALGDIMGFRSLLEALSLDDLVSHQLATFRRVIAHSLQQGDHTPPPDVSLAKLRSQARVGFAWFSDTVLIYGLDDSDLACHNVVETAGWMIYETVYGAPSTKLRIGIGYGELHADVEDELFVGKALAEAHAVESAQDWTGGALSRNAKSRVLRTRSPQLPTSGWWLTSYAVPVKAQARTDLVSDLAVDWTVACSRHWDVSWTSELREPTTEDWLRRPDICRKWANTREFHRRVCRRCQFRNTSSGSA